MAAALLTPLFYGILGHAATTSFQQCIISALNNNDHLYAFPSDLLYHVTDDRPYNLDYPSTPAAIVYPQNMQQVSSAVSCVAQHGIVTQDLTGGHNLENFGMHSLSIFTCPPLTHAYTGLGGGFSDSILTVNFKNMKDFTYQPADETVTFEPGVLLGDLDTHLAQIHRVVEYGVVSDIGSSGNLAIGGFGPLSRQLGIAAGQILSAQCVLGDGSIVTTSQSKNLDLLFAIKGAAWSFALVTSFTMQTAPPPSQVISCQYNIPAESLTDLADTFKSWQKLVSQPGLDRRFASTLTLANPGILVFSGTLYGDRCVSAHGGSARRESSKRRSYHGSRKSANNSANIIACTALVL